MIQVTFTENLKRHVDIDAITVGDGNLESVLNAVFEHYPALKTYVVDEQYQLRQHVMLAKPSRAKLMGCPVLSVST
jgi:hypothetical protein